jgi:hypothetical protein
MVLSSNIKKEVVIMADYVDFHHDTPSCGGRFQTKLIFMADFPGRVVCPACPGSGDPEERTAAMKRLAAAIVELRIAKADLEQRLRLRLVEFLY